MTMSDARNLSGSLTGGEHVINTTWKGDRFEVTCSCGQAGCILAHGYALGVEDGLRMRPPSPPSPREPTISNAPADSSESQRFHGPAGFTLPHHVRDANAERLRE